jgi:hypothetical protein
VPVSVVLAIGCGVLWAAVVVRVRWRGPRASRSLQVPQLPPVSGADDGPVPEPVRLVLRHTRQSNDPAVLNAAVLELAEAGLFRIEPADSQHPAMVSPNVLPHASTLPPYQASVVARLLHRRGVGQKPVPLTALQPGEDDAAAKWHKDFVRQVRQAATERGLLQPPASGAQLVLAFALGIFASDRTASVISHFGHAALVPLVFIPLAVLTVVGVFWAGRVRPTAAGRALLAEMPRPTPTGPEPTFAAPPSTIPAEPRRPASAPDPTTVMVLPNQLQPLPANQVWSDYGGSWHPLDIESKETYSINSGIPGFFILILFAALSLAGVIFAGHVGDPSGAVPFLVFGALPVILLVGAAANLLRRRRLPKRAVVRGQIAKLWTVTHRGGESSTTYYYCSLDTGRAPASVRLKIHRTLYGRLQVGAEIEVLVNPRRRSIKDVRFGQSGG